MHAPAASVDNSVKISGLAALLSSDQETAQLLTAGVQHQQPETDPSHAYSDDGDVKCRTFDVEASWEDHLSDGSVSMVSVDDLIQQLVSNNYRLCQ